MKNVFLTMFMFIGFANVMLAKNLSTETRTLEPFHSVKVYTAISVEIVKSTLEKAEIESTHLDKLDIKVKDGVLYIGYLPNLSLQNANTKVKVFAKNLNSLIVENASVVKVKGIFETDKQSFFVDGGSSIQADAKAKELKIVAQNASNFSGKINAEKLELKAQSASQINVSGIADLAIIKADGASVINAKSMAIKKVDTKADGVSRILVSVSKELNAEALAMSSIMYKTLSGIKFSAVRKTGGIIDML